MPKITATFDGLQINIEGGESVTAHQLYIVAEQLRKHGTMANTLPETMDMIGPAIVIVFDGFEAIASRTSATEPGHTMALAAEFALAAQHIFSLPRLGAVIQSTVQATLQAIAQNAENQRLMASVKRSPGGVILPS